MYRDIPKPVVRSKELKKLIKNNIIFVNSLVGDVFRNGVQVEMWWIEWKNFTREIHELLMKANLRHLDGDIDDDGTKWWSFINDGVPFDESGDTTMDKFYVSK